MKNTTKKRTLTIIFLGLQGSGKGTQSQFLSDKYGFHVIDTGALIRKAIAEDTIPTKDKLLTIKGKLVRILTVIRLVENQIKKISKSADLIIDGSPRSMGETYALMSILKSTNRLENLIVIDFKISKNTVFHRIANRLICTKCGRIATGLHKKCHCGGEFKKRSDDNMTVLKNRLKFVSKDLDAIKAYFKKRKLLLIIDGEQSPKTILETIVMKVGL